MDEISHFGFLPARKMPEKVTKRALAVACCPKPHRRVKPAAAALQYQRELAL